MRWLLVLFLVVLASGCVTPASSGPGVSLSLSSSPASIRDTQPFLLTAAVKNTGDFDVDQADLYIYGLGEGGEWDIKSVNGANKKSDWHYTIDGLKASNREIGYSAQEKKATMFLQYAGALPKGQVFTFAPSARLCYGYKSVAKSKIDIYSKEEYYRENPQQRSISVSQTGAPIRVGIDTLQPLIEGEKALLEITLSNIGGGTVTSLGCDEVNNIESFDSLNTVKSFVIKLNGKTCLKQSGSDTYYLKNGQSAEFTIECDGFDVSSPKETKDIDMEVKYTYYLDAKTAVSVEGTRRIDDVVPAPVDEISGEGRVFLKSGDTKTFKCESMDEEYRLTMNELSRGGDTAYFTLEVDGVGREVFVVDGETFSHEDGAAFNVIFVGESTVGVDISCP